MPIRRGFRSPDCAASTCGNKSALLGARSLPGLAQKSADHTEPFPRQAFRPGYPEGRGYRKVHSCGHSGSPVSWDHVAGVTAISAGHRSEREHDGP